MRMPVILSALTITLGSAWAQNPIPFVDGVPAPVEKSMADKSLGNKLDPLGAWKESDVELPEATKGLAGGAGASVHNLAIKTAEGQLIVSQLWDASCTNTDCPTQVYLLKDDGTRVEKLAPMMLPQIIPPEGSEATKGLSPEHTNPSIFLNPDGKSITAVTNKGNKQVYSFQ